MSKSAGNGVDPRLMIEQYGADSLRLWMSFIGDYGASVTWSEDGLKACNRLINRIWAMQEFLVDGDEYSKELEFAMHSTIKKVSADIDSTKFNTAIASIMTLVNEIYKVGKVNKAEYKSLLLLISPFAPHVVNELYEELNLGPNFEDERWPQFSEEKLELDEIEIPVQINGKLRGKVIAQKNVTQEELVKLATENSEIAKYITNSPKKIIYVPNKIFNIVV